MERLQEKLFVEVETEQRFSAQKSEYHLIHNDQGSTICHETVRDDDGCSDPILPRWFTNHHLTNTIPSSSCRHDSGHVWKCVFQRSRPRHISGSPDHLPFPNLQVVRHIFKTLGLPIAYFQLADGSLASAQSYIVHNPTGRPRKFELIAHCPNRQGDWAMALTHRGSSKDTSVFWSVDERVDADRLLEDVVALRDYASHPMLAPCIMFAATLRIAIERRRSIKSRLATLEERIQRLRRRLLHDWEGDLALDVSDLDELFGLLHECRAEQGSREGRYHFLKSLHDAVQEGFRYSDQVLLCDRLDETAFKLHTDLLRWATVTWHRLESLKARDKDHVSRVDNVSNLLCDLVRQRDSRIQAKIARASQRDSEDMKFIALLGSVFLPASLVATVLNVPDFQFLPGRKLFGVYVAITGPFIGFVVALCLLRPHWKRWTQRNSVKSAA